MIFDKTTNIINMKKSTILILITCLLGFSFVPAISSSPGVTERVTIVEEVQVITLNAFIPQRLTSAASRGVSVTIQFIYKDLDADVVIEFTQSLDNENFDLIEGSAGFIDKDNNSHTFTLQGLNTNFIQPIIHKQKATTGEITELRYIWRD